MQRMWIVIAGVVVLALVLAGGGYWWLRHSPKHTVAAKMPNLIGVLGENIVALDTAAPDQDKLCSVSLTRALDFGAVPPGTRLVSSEAQAGQPEGRFACQAQGIDGKYTLNIDTSCPNSEAKTCFTLDSIRREDGVFVYQREM